MEDECAAIVQGLPDWRAMARLWAPMERPSPGVALRDEASTASLPMHASADDSDDSYDEEEEAEEELMRANTTHTLNMIAWRNALSYVA